jgi:hypothetical protein
LSWKLDRETTPSKVSGYALGDCDSDCVDVRVFRKQKRKQHFVTISHPDIRVKHCAYGVVTLLNPRVVITISHKHSITVATVVVAVPSTVHYPANYKIL